MKKLLFLVAITVIAFSSCKKDDIVWPSGGTNCIKDVPTVIGTGVVYTGDIWGSPNYDVTLFYLNKRNDGTIVASWQGTSGLVTDSMPVVHADTTAGQPAGMTTFNFTDFTNTDILPVKIFGFANPIKKTCQPSRDTVFCSRTAPKHGRAVGDIIITAEPGSEHLISQMYQMVARAERKKE